MVLWNLPLNFRALAVAALAIVTLASISVGPTGTGDAVETSNLPLRKAADVPLGGRTTRFDYESFDSMNCPVSNNVAEPAARWLYIR